MDAACRIVATGLALGLACGLGTAGASPPEGTESAVYAKGRRARIEGTRLRPARLVFADMHVTVDLPGHDSERFGYDTIRFQRGRTPARWSLFDKTYWLTTLPGVPLCPWPVFPGGLPRGDPCAGRVALARQSRRPASAGPALRRLPPLLAAGASPRRAAAARDPRRVRAALRQGLASPFRYGIASPIRREAGRRRTSRLPASMACLGACRNSAAASCC